MNSTELLIRRSRGIRDAGTLMRQNMKVLRGIILQVMENTMYFDISHMMLYWYSTIYFFYYCYIVGEQELRQSLEQNLKIHNNV